MNSKTKRRLGAVTGVIVIVLVLLLAIVGGNTAARTVSVAEAREIPDDGKIQVTGNVVENSFSIDGDVLTFEVYDPDEDPAAAAVLPVSYDGGVAATFGNDVTAICTGKKNAAGTLVCSELVTKCPSKYENAAGALTVAGLLDYGEAIIGKPVKVAGAIEAGTLTGVDAAERFVLADAEGMEGAEGAASIPVRYDGALSDDEGEGARVVLIGSLGADGAFTATVVALEE